MKNLKKLMEQRAELHERMKNLLDTADNEERAITAEEQTQFDELEQQIKDIDATINAEMRARGITDTQPAAGSAEEQEERAFADYILGRASEMRAGEQNMTMGNNAGAIVPTTIANRIIKAIKDISPILSRVTMYNVKGTLKIPVWGKANGHDIKVGYQAEFTELVADSGKFTSIDLTGYLAGCLVLIGRSIENNAQFSVVNFIVAQIAEEIAVWIEGQLLNGTGINAAQGVLLTENTVTAASATAITADELIDLQAAVKQAYQSNAMWIMSPATFTAIRKLKAADNRYLMQEDITSEFPYRLLGKPVYLSDNMPAAKAGNKAIVYGDFSGLSVNFRENVSIEVLREKYATQHAIGVVAWFEFDARITDHARIATLTMKAA